MNTQQFNSWKAEQEARVKDAGYSIKIVSKKSYTFKTILAYVGGLFIFTLILGTISYKVIADNLDEDKSMTIKVVQEITLSPELESYIENKSIEINDWVNEKLESFSDE